MISLGGQAPHVCSTRALDTCGEPNDSESTVHVFTCSCTALVQARWAWAQTGHGSGTCREPFNSAQMGVNPVSFASPHVRCTPMGLWYALRAV